jgi:hypothetical protein
VIWQSEEKFLMKKGLNYVIISNLNQSARQYQIPFYEASAKSSINIDAGFTHMTKNILNRELSINGSRAAVRKQPAGVRLQ